MIKEYAEFERKRRDGNPNEEKRSSVRQSYAEFIKNNPTSEKPKTSEKDDIRYKTSSLPAPFQVAEKMRENVTDAMDRSKPVMDAAYTIGKLAHQEKQAEQKRIASLPLPLQYAEKMRTSAIKATDTALKQPVISDVRNAAVEQYKTNQIRQSILENGKKDKERFESNWQGKNTDKDNWVTDFSEQIAQRGKRKTQIKQEYNYLDEETMAELRVIADGKDAEQMTSGATGVQMAMFGGEEYGKARQRVLDGEEARKRLHEQGYSYMQIDKWTEMTQDNIHQQYNADWAEYAKEHPVVASAASVSQKFMVAPLNVASTIDGIVSNDIKSNDLITAVTQSDKVMRQSVAEEIGKKSKAGEFLYTTGMSGVDSIASRLVPGGRIFQAIDTATNGMRRASEKGFTTSQSVAVGVAEATFEYVFENWSIENFDALKSVSPATLKDVVWNVIKSLPVEASEEMFTEAANIATDWFVDFLGGGGASDYALLVKKYESQGMNPDEAKSKAITDLAMQVGEAGLAGTLMGIGFSAGGSAIGYTANHSDIKATGKRIKSYDGGVESAIEIGKTAPEKSRPYKVAEKAQKKQSKGKELSDWGVGIIATEAMRYASENAPQLEGAFASAKTVDDVNRIYDAELDKLKSYPSTAKDLKTSIKHLDAQRSTALKSLTKYNSSGARMMVEGQPASIENLVKTKMPTIGKTDDGRVVSVSSADSVNDGVVTVKTSEGTTQTLDTQALTGKAKELWSYAADNFNDADAINAFVEGYDGGSIDTYSRLFKSTYQMASTGMTEAEIKKENLFNVNQLSQKAFSQAVSTGTKLANNKVGVLDVSTDIKSNSQKLTINMMDNFAKRHGLSIVVVDTLGGTEGKYKPSSNQIVVALDASGGALNRVFGHETYHYLKQKNAMQAEQISNFVFDTMTKLKGKEWVDNFIDKTYDKETYKTEEARREDFVADQMFEVFANERAVKEFAAKDASLLQKISAHIKSLIAEVKSILKKLVASGEHEDIAAWQEDLDSLQKLNDMVLDALANVEQTGNLTVQEKQAIDAFGDDLGQIETNADGDATLITNEDESVIVYSEVTWNNGGKGALEKALKRNGYNATEVADIIDSVDDIAAFLKDMSQNYADNMGYTLLAEHLAADVTMDVKNGKAVLHSIVNNGDYPVNIDLALNCKKRVAYMRVMRDLINNGIFEKVKYNGDAIAKVNEILRKNGFETACLGCFVESRRLQFQAWAETIVQEWNNAVDKYNKNAKYFGYAKVQKGASSLTVDEIIKIDQELSSAEKNEQGNVKLGSGAVATKMGKLLKMSPTLRQKITVADLLTPEGLTNLRRENPNLFSLVKSRYGAASPKIVQDYNPYSGEMANLSFARVKDITHNSIKGSSDYIKEAEQYLADSKPVQPKNTNATEYKQSKEYREWDEKVQTLAMRNYLYDIGGARMQSFSDFMIENVFDYVQIIADLAANKFPMHTYTKEIVMMRLFGMSGIKMNGSVICHTDPTLDQKYAGLLPASEAENGNAILVHTEEGDFAIGFDDYARHALTKGTEEESYIQSIGFKDIIALQLDKRYSPYVGSITIGVSDLHIKAMLDSPLFRMVIPYHASGMLPQFAKLVGVDKYNDYTNYQNTTVKQCYDVNGKPVSRFKKGDKDLAIDTSYPFNAELQKVKDPKVAADNYIEWCAEKHPVYDGKTLVGYATFAPKFSNSPYGTDFSKHPNYYKLLEDFDVYDSVTETYSEQGAVGMVFPSAENQLTEAELAEYRTRLEDTGVFSAKEIDKYVSRANMTFEEIIKAELDNRSLYESTQSKKYDATIKEISDTLVKDYSRSGQISSYKEFANTLKKGTTKQKEEQKGKLPLRGTYDTTAGNDDVMWSKKRVEHLTQSDAVELFEKCQNGEYRQNSYIPVSRTTPSIVIEKANRFVKLEPYPLFMKVEKVQQMIEDEDVQDGGSRFHGVDSETATQIFEKIFNPNYIFYQKDNNRVTVIVRLGKSKNAFVTLDKGRNFNPDILNGYEGGMYNVSVTVYYLDNLKKYMSNENNVLLYDKSKANHEEASGSLVPSLSNDSPYFENIVIRNQEDVNTKFSIKRDNAVEEVKFSTKRNTSISEDASNYIASTEEFQEAISILGERFELAGKVTLSPKAIDRLAGRLLDKSKSNYSREQLTERLTALFDYIANSRDVSWEEITTIAANISKDMLKESSVLDRSMQKEYSDVLDLMKESKVYISPEVRQEIGYNFGSYEAFRKAMGNKLKVTVTDTSAVPLDVFWRELSENRPEMFDAEENVLDMPSRLAEFFEMTAPQYVNPYDNFEMDMDEAAYDFALQMYDEYFNIPEVKTEARKYALKEERLKGKYNAKIKDIRKTYQERISTIRKEKNNKIEATKAYYREKHEAYREKRNETQDKQRLRASIVRTSKKLVEKLVKPTDTKYIPQELVKPVTGFCQMITDTGVFDYEKADKLREAYQNIINGKIGESLESVTDEVTIQDLETAKKLLKGKQLSQLNVDELRLLRNITKDLHHLVTTTNKMFNENIREGVVETGENIISEIGQFNERLKNKRFDSKRFATEAQRGLIKPATFFDLVETPTLQKLYQNVRNGESEWYRTASDIKSKLASLQEQYGYEDWKNKTVGITRERGGDKLYFTMEEALSIYATAKREQGLKHLLTDGFVRQEDEYKKIYKALKKEYRKNSSMETPKDIIKAMKGNAVTLTAKDIASINSAIDKISTNAKKYADGFVSYMSKDMADLGNKTAVKLKGRKIFGESYYFPIVSDPNHLNFSAAKGVDARIKNMSATKATVENASNAIVIGSFTDTSVKHCLDMAMYSSFTLPLEDFTRAYNYKVKSTAVSDSTSVRQSLEKAFGSGAHKYISQLLTDINGGVVQKGAGVINKLITVSKRDAVMGSLSVAIQQPSAIGRALAYIDLGNFFELKKPNIKNEWAELKKYAPVAGVKEMGYFDTNIGKSALDWVTDGSTKDSVTFGDKLVNARDKTVDFLSRLPSKMDEVTWVKIWNAVKKETAKNNPKMDRTSEEFLKLAGERFTYVIDRTQVYDSVFARSEWMRAKDSGIKQVMSFMNEPLVSLNMLYEATVMNRENKGRFVARTAASLLVATALNSALKAVIQTMRDDDDETTPWEQYLANLIDNIVYEPLGWIPFIGDLFESKKTGFDGTNMHESTISDIADSLLVWFDDKKSTYQKLKTTCSGIGLLTGLPVKNVWREFEAMKNAFKATIIGTENMWGDQLQISEKIAEMDWLFGESGALFTEADRKLFAEGGSKTTAKGIGFAIHNAVEWEDLKFTKDFTMADQAVIAYLDGDQTHADKAFEILLRKKGDQDEVESTIRTAVKNRYLEGDITKAEVEDILVNFVGDDEDDIYWKLEEWQGGEDWSKFGDFYDAIDSGENLKSVIKYYTDNDVKKSTLASRITSNYKKQYIELYKTDRKAASKLKSKLVEAYAALGYKRSKKSKDIDAWLKEKK